MPAFISKIRSDLAFAHDSISNSPTLKRACIVTAESTLEYLLGFVRESQQIPSDDEFYGPEVDLFDYGYLDSFGIVAFIEAVDQTFGIDMSMVDFYDDEFRTLAQLAAYIDAQRG
jgi:methoxymalonate biosynthesis acyl carrier protein